MTDPITKRDLAAWVLYTAKPLQHKQILEVSTKWVEETFPHAEKEAKEKFVSTFAAVFSRKVSKDRNSGRFLTLDKNQAFLNEIIPLQSDPDQPSPPKARKLSKDDEIDFMRQGIAFFKPRGDDAL